MEGRTEERKMGRQMVSWGQRGDRESLFEATGRGGRGGGGVGGGGGRVPWVIPCPSPRSIAQIRLLADRRDNDDDDHVVEDRRRVHRAKYDLECGNRVEGRGGNGERKRERIFLDRIPVARLDGNGWILKVKRS